MYNLFFTGRNALGRHMKSVHPAVLGPYKCPLFHTCGKMLESGVKVQKHMYLHVGRRSQAVAEDRKFTCPSEKVCIQNRWCTVYKYLDLYIV